VGNVTVNLGVRVAADDRLKDLARDLAALAKLPGVPQADVQRIKDYANSVRNVKTQYDSASSSAFKMFDQAKSIGTSALGGAGLGKYAMLLGAGGVGAAVAAAAAIASQLARMQYQFLETTTKSAATLSIGSGDFRRNLESIQKASFAGVSYGIAQNQMAGALATYGGASGYLPSAGFAGSLAEYSRGSGVDVNQLAGEVGGISQFGGDPTKIMKDAFDQAMTSGAFGRRLTEFILAIAGMTQQLALANPNLTGAQAAAMATRAVGNIASAGGVYSTQAGNAATLSAFSAFGGAARGNQQVMSLALMAGVDPAKAMLGQTTPEDELKMMQIAHGIYGKSPLMGAAFASQFQGGALMWQFAGDHPNLDLNSPAGKKYQAQFAAKQVGGTDYGQISGDIAKIVSELQKDIGGTVLHDMVVPVLNEVAKFVTAFGATGKGLDSSMMSLTEATLALTAVQALAGGAGLISKIGPLLLAGGLGAAGVAAAATIGFVAATTASGGNADEDQYVKSWNKYRKETKPAGMSDSDWSTIVNAGLNKGVDPELLAAVYGQESDYGRGLTAQGTNKAGNAFGGFQLTAGAGKYGSFDNRLQAAHSLSFAASIAAEMLKANLAEHGGNVHAALAEYGPPESQVHDYAGQVESRYANIRGVKVKVTTHVSDAGNDRSSVHNNKRQAVPRKK
jgi:hypothetical protein